MKDEYFECHCYSDEHRLTFKIDEGEEHWPPEMWAGIFLNQYRNIFKRIWIAIKYVLGYKCKYGHFDCFTLKPEDADRMADMLDQYVSKHNQWVAELKKKDA